MTEEQILRAQALDRVTFQLGSPDKRFAREMASRSRQAEPQPLTEKQDAYLTRLAWRYRRQLPASVVPSERPV